MFVFKKLVVFLLCCSCIKAVYAAPNAQFGEQRIKSFVRTDAYKLFLAGLYLSHNDPFRFVQQYKSLKEVSDAERLALYEEGIVQLFERNQEAYALDLWESYATKDKDLQKRHKNLGLLALPSALKNRQLVVRFADTWSDSKDSFFVRNVWLSKEEITADSNIMFKELMQECQQKKELIPDCPFMLLPEFLQRIESKEEFWEDAYVEYSEFFIQQILAQHKIQKTMNNVVEVLLQFHLRISVLRGFFSPELFVAAQSETAKLYAKVLRLPIPLAHFRLELARMLALSGSEKAKKTGNALLANQFTNTNILYSFALWRVALALDATQKIPKQLLTPLKITQEKDWENVFAQWRFINALYLTRNTKNNLLKINGISQQEVQKFIQAWAETPTKYKEKYWSDWMAIGLLYEETEKVLASIQTLTIPDKNALPVAKKEFLQRLSVIIPFDSSAAIVSSVDAVLQKFMVIHPEPSEELNDLQLVLAAYQKRPFAEVKQFGENWQSSADPLRSGNSYAYTLVDAGYPLEEIKIIIQFMEPRSQFIPGYLDTLAWYETKQKNYQRAEELLQRVVFVLPVLEVVQHLFAVQKLQNKTTKEFPWLLLIH